MQLGVEALRRRQEDIGTRAAATLGSQSSTTVFGEPDRRTIVVAGVLGILIALPPSHAASLHGPSARPKLRRDNLICPKVHFNP